MIIIGILILGVLLLILLAVLFPRDIKLLLFLVLLYALAVHEGVLPTISN